jgi:hypothetical protein
VTQRPPPNYWATLIALGSLAVSGLSMMLGANKSNAEDTRHLEQRLCRLEARAATGDCK